MKRRAGRAKMKAERVKIEAYMLISREPGPELGNLIFETRGDALFHRRVRMRKPSLWRIARVRITEVTK